MSRCSRCNKRPAKRPCPALLSSICTVCCAQDRMMDIRCPESCTYLEQGRNTEANKAAQLTLAQIGPELMRRVYENQRCLAVITFLERTVAETQRDEYNDLVDAEVISALGNTLKN